MTSATVLPRTHPSRARRERRSTHAAVGGPASNSTDQTSSHVVRGPWLPRATCRVAWSMRRVPFGGGGHVALPITPGSEFDSFRRAAGGAAEGHPTQFPAP